MIFSLYSKNGGEEFSWPVLDGDSIDLSHFNSGEYLIIIKDFNKILYTTSINLK